MANSAVRNACLGGAVLYALTASNAVAAQTRDIKILSQPASRSIPELARQAGIQVLVSERAVRGKTTPSVRGRMTPEDALRRLIEGTGLKLKQYGDRTYILASAMAIKPPLMTRLASPSQQDAVSTGTASPLAQTASTAGPDTSINADQDIVVTAQKRSQNLQDVSLSISAISAQTLADKRVNDVRDVAARLPNVSVGNYLGSAQIAVRGIGNTSAFTGADPSVALHVDGAVVSQPGAQLGSFFDLERIEVLRGPQGTLYGRNATGGVMNLVTAKPTEALSGYIRGSLGNYDFVQAEGAISGAIVADKVRARVAFKTEDRGGYGRNEFTGNDIDDAHRRSVRGQVDFRPSEDLSILLSAEYSHEDDSAYGPKFRSVSFPSPINASLRPPGGAAYASNRRDINSETDTANNRTAYGFSGTINWDIRDDWSLKSITNYRYYRGDNVWDFSTTPTSSATVQNLIVKSKSASEELQLSYDGDGWRLALSGYYFHEDLFGLNATGIRPRNSASIVNRFTGTITTDSYAAFLNLDYALTPQLNINLGARYTHEIRSGDTATFVQSTGITTPFSTGGKFDDFSPKATLEWRPINGVMAYATFSRGFKSGVVLIGAGTTPILEPERVDNYEIGAKLTLLDRALVFNVAAFHEDYSNMQVTVQQAPPGSTTIITTPENAASSKLDGVEVEMSWNVTPRFNFHGSVGYLHARFSDYVTADPLDADIPPGGAVPLQQLAGRQLPFAPKWSATAGASYAVPLSWGKFVLSGDVQSKSRHYPNQFNNPELELGYTTVDAGIKYTTEDERISVNVWGRNLTDAFYWASSNVNGTSRQIIGSQGEPRTYGVTVGYTF